jgi:hypothetical protein
MPVDTKKIKKDATPAKRRCDTASQTLGVSITNNNSNPKHPAWHKSAIMCAGDRRCRLLCVGGGEKEEDRKRNI